MLTHSSLCMEVVPPLHFYLDGISLAVLPTSRNPYELTASCERRTHMKTGYCPKCGNSCEVIFTRYIRKEGKIIYPKKGKVFVIPQCDCTSKAAA